MSLDEEKNDSWFNSLVLSKKGGVSGRRDPEKEFKMEEKLGEGYNEKHQF